MEEIPIDQKVLDEKTPTEEKLREAIKNAKKESDDSKTPFSEQEKQDLIHYSDWLALLGFETEQNALQSIQQQGLKNFNREYWLPKIRTANTVVNKISNRQNLRPEIKQIDEKYNERFEKLQKEQTFQEHLIGMKSHRFAFVELSKIHCFQTMLNTEFIESLVKKAPEPSDVQETIKFCLPTQEEKAVNEVMSTTNKDNTISFISDNLDFRILGLVQGEDTNTRRKFSGFQYGFGLPLISVVEYKGILLIKNGYHRAFALLRKGHKFLPCLLLQTDNYQGTGAQSDGFFPIDLIMSDKSPILDDFTSEAAIVIPRRRFKKMIMIHAEPQIMPV